MLISQLVWICVTQHHHCFPSILFSLHLIWLGDKKRTYVEREEVNNIFDIINDDELWFVYIALAFLIFDQS